MTELLTKSHINPESIIGAVHIKQLETSFDGAQHKTSELYLELYTSFVGANVCLIQILLHFLFRRSFILI